MHILPERTQARMPTSWASPRRPPQTDAATGNARCGEVHAERTAAAASCSLKAGQRRTQPTEPLVLLERNLTANQRYASCQNSSLDFRWKPNYLSVWPQGCSSVGRASVSKTEGRGFESLRPCHARCIGCRDPKDAALSGRLSVSLLRLPVFGLPNGSLRGLCRIGGFRYSASGGGSEEPSMNLPAVAVRHVLRWLFPEKCWVAHPSRPACQVSTRTERTLQTRAGLQRKPCLNGEV